MRQILVLASACLLPWNWEGSASVFVDITPGTGAPPGTLGGYAMGAFPADLSAEGTLTSSLTPPPAFPGSGSLGFTTEVEHMKVGSWWDTWSHGYLGSVYFTPDHQLLMTLPQDTLAFHLYIEPNLKATFEFQVDASATTVTLDIDGNGGARYVGFYSDNPLDPLKFVYIRQTTMDADGFAVGEFGINVPEPLTSGLAAGLGLVAWAAARRLTRTSRREFTRQP
jgi:hypothetical protein